MCPFFVYGEKVVSIVFFFFFFFFFRSADSLFLYDSGGGCRDWGSKDVKRF